MVLCDRGHENPGGARFCNVCASPLAVRCPACGHANPAASRFCSECSAKLSDSATSRESLFTSRGALEAERKQVTVLFADLKGSTELLAHRDPKDARRILDPVLELMMEAVHRYDGTVNQVMGDGIMALFGAPLAQEDHAIRACYAAIRMQEAVARHAEEVQRAEGVRVQIRVGLNSGEVVVRTIAGDVRMDYSAVGQVTHIAARMEQLARPGTTLLTDSPATLTLGYVAVESLGDMEVKGLDRPVSVYELMGLGPARSRLDAAIDRRLTPFVGRDEELRRLRAITRLTRRGSGRVVGLCGGAGIGKSRLIHELLETPELRGWRIIQARAALFSRATPYAAAADLLRSYLGVDSRDSPDRLRDSIDAAVGRNLPEGRAALLALLDISPDDSAWDTVDPPERRQRTIESLLHLLHRQALNQPLLIVIEDVHWIDRESDAFLARLAARIAGARLLLLLSYRPEHELRWRDGTIFSELTVGPLSTAGADELLSRVLGDDPALRDVRRMLLDRTAGNPFFLEEMLRELVESGVLVREGHGHRLARDLAYLRVPATVHAVLASRVDRLAPIDKLVLQAASVGGDTVPVRVLEASGQVPRERLGDALTRLKAAEFVYPTGAGSNTEYHFSHALTREVVYSTLLKEQRRTLHARIVGAIESVHADRLGDHVELLGHHAVQGELWEKAVDYLREAGARAAGRGALTDSLRCYEQALDITGRLAPSVDNTKRATDVRLDFHVPLFPLGQTSRLLALYREAEELANRLDDPARLGRITYRLGAYCWVAADYADGVRYARRAVAIADARDDRELRLAATHVLAMNHEAPGDYLSAIPALFSIVDGPDAELARTRRGVTIPTYTAGCAWLALCFAELGDFPHSLTWGEQAVEAARTSQHALGEAVALTLRAYAPLYRGDFTDALAWCEQAVALCDGKGLHGWRPVAYSAYGQALAGAGRPLEGVRYLERAVTLNEQMGIRTRHAHSCARWAEAQLIAGHPAEAWRTADRALSTALAYHERANEARARYILAEASAARHPADHDPALGRYEEAAAVAERLGMRPLVAHCHLGLGKLYRRTDKREPAWEHLATATTMYREMGMTYWLEKAEAEMAELG
jgi:class 3 adenylate cyclase/tetratricopeptide (TPR) repeat protein